MSGGGSRVAANAVVGPDASADVVAQLKASTSPCRYSTANGCCAPWNFH